MFKVKLKNGEEIILGLREVTSHIANQSDFKYQSEEWWKVNFQDRSDEVLMNHIKSEMFPDCVKVELFD
jgi:hypothetical protein